MGQIRKRGGIWWIRYCRNGKRYEESAESEKKQAAIDLLKLREGDGVRGVPVTSKIGRFLFDEAAADLLTNYQINGRRSSASVQRRITLALAPYFTGRRMATITTADVSTYIAMRLAPIRREDGTENPGAAHATINRELAALKRMYALAIRGGKLLHRPYIPMLVERNARQGFFERDQFDSVYAHLPAPLQAVMICAYVTGWRTKSEILPLQWAQVDRAAGILRLEPNTTKNAEGREFVYALIDNLRDTIDGQWRAHEALKRQGVICPWVFHRAGTPIKSYRRAWVSACRRAGCPGRIPHDFRRTAVRNLVRAGVSEQVAMRMTGHKTRCVFDRYDIVSGDDLKQASAKLNAMLTETNGTKMGQFRVSRADELERASE